MYESQRHNPEASDQQTPDELNIELVEIALSQERRAIETRLEEIYNSPPFIKIYGQTAADQRIEEIHKQSQEDYSGLNLSSYVRHLRSIIQQYAEVFQNYEDNKDVFTQRSIETRERVARVYDVAMPGVEAQFDAMQSDGRLVEKENQKMAIDFTHDRFQELRRNGFTLFTLQHMLRNQVDVTDDELRDAISATSHAAIHEKYLRNKYPTKEFAGGQKLCLLDAYETGYMNGLSVPVGEYGEELSNRLLETVRRSAAVLTESRSGFEQAESDLGEEEVHHFVRSVDKDSEDVATMLTFYEGMLSVQQAISLLTAERIPGYEYKGEDQMVEDIIESGIINQLARVIPLGLVGPMTLIGLHFEYFVTYSDGKFTINRDLVKQWHDERIRTRIHYETGSREVLEDGMNARITMKGCPAAIRRDGDASTVEKMSQFFLKVFKSTGEEEARA